MSDLAKVMAPMRNSRALCMCSSALAICFAANSLIALRVVAGDEDAKSLLRRVAETYKSDRYILQCKSVLSMDVAGFVQKVETSVTIAADGPGRRYISLSSPGMLMVSNEDSTWAYMAPMNVYSSEASVLDENLDGVSLMFGRSPAYFAALNKSNEGPRDLGVESVTAGGRTIECRKIEVAFPFARPNVTFHPDTLWIDPTTANVMRSRSHIAMPEKQAVIKTDVIYEKVDFNNAPDSLFVFIPPKGARRMDANSSSAAMFNSIDLTGKDASEFELRDAEGKMTSLSTYRGNVVVVDFWATWCAPCRMALPDLATLQKEFGQRGLTVLAISREGDVAHALLRKSGYGLKSLHDVDGIISEKYQVRALPTTLVIGKDGKVVAHTTGRRPLSELREDLAKAGLK
jgi:thiol-disulfide isomerase/thioredoxin